MSVFNGSYLVTFLMNQTMIPIRKVTYMNPFFNQPKHIFIPVVIDKCCDWLKRTTFGALFDRYYKGL